MTCARFCIVLHVHRGRRSRGLLERFGNDHRDILAPVANDLVFKSRAHFAVGRVVVAGNGAIQRADVAVVQHEQHAGHLLRGGSVERSGCGRSRWTRTTGTAWAMRSKWKSAAYSAVPVVFSGPSMRGVGLPMIDASRESCSYVAFFRAALAVAQFSVSNLMPPELSDFNRSSIRIGQIRARARRWRDTPRP